VTSQYYSGDIYLSPPENTNGRPKEDQSQTSVWKWLRGQNSGADWEWWPAMSEASLRHLELVWKHWCLWQPFILARRVKRYDARILRLQRGRVQSVCVVGPLMGTVYHRFDTIDSIRTLYCYGNEEGEGWRKPI
jgi:hypothetical protein